MYKMITLATALVFAISASVAAQAATVSNPAAAPDIAVDGKDAAPAKPAATSRYKRIRAKAHRNAARAKAQARALRAADEAKS